MESLYLYRSRRRETALTVTESGAEATAVSRDAGLARGPRDSRIARSVWTAARSPPLLLLPCCRTTAFQTRLAHRVLLKFLMRLWTLHPKYLDARGLVALWREALLAQKVLRGATRGYKHHPQLRRFSGFAEPRKEPV